jgi:streptogramin lyase
VVASLLCLFVLAGCETRDRDNPFDPMNPDTGGVPPAIEALAGDGRIELSWDLSGFEDIGTVALERADAAEPPRVLSPAVGLTEAYVDETVDNGTTYAYRLVVSTQEGDRLESTSELATPGASIVWFGDAAGLGIGRLAPDGRDPLFRVGTGRAFLDLSIDLRGGVWAADYFNSQIVQLDPEGELVRILPRAGANVVAYDPASAQVWVGSYFERSLSRYAATDGGLNLELEDIGFPEDLEVEPFPGAGLWVATQDMGVLRVDNNRVERSWPDFVRPVALSRDPAGWVWIVDRGAGSVSRLLISTGEVFVADAALVDPRDCTLDGAGGVYVADPGRGGVVHVDRDGIESAFWDLPAASGVTRNPRSGLLWVVFRDSGEIGVYDSAGNELSRLGVSGSPVKVEGLWK